MLGLYLSLYILAGASCHGDGQVASHLLLIESLPEGFDLDKPTFLNVRTNLSVSFVFPLFHSPLLTYLLHFLFIRHSLAICKKQK